jgi:hypothetical protein
MVAVADAQVTTMTNECVLRTVVMLAVLLTASSIPLLANAGTAGAGAGAPVAAVWQPQVLKFEYRAGNTIYMCRSLQRKVERILLQVGGRERVQFRRFRCGDLAHSVSAEIALMTPLEATAENIQHLTDYDSKDVLVARARGQRLPSASELQVFPAAWQTVTVSGMKLGRGDCELLQQLRQQVLSKLSVRIVTDNLEQCSTVFARGVAPRLVVRALVAESVDRIAESR